MDYLTTMKAWCSRSFKAYLDVACLSELESPINLKTHYHEELVARTAEEMKEFQDITRLPTDDKSEIEDRRLKLRNWYERALARKEEDFGGKCPVEELKDFSDYEKEIFNEIENHDRTIFFGGASLTLLNHLIEKKPALAKKVEYYQQGVWIIMPSLLCCRHVLTDTLGNFRFQAQYFGKSTQLCAEYESRQKCF